MYTEVKTKEKAKEKVCTLIDEGKHIKTVRKRSSQGDNTLPQDHEVYVIRWAW